MYIVSILMIDSKHFFVEYLFTLKSKVQQLQNEFSKISTIEEWACKVHLHCVFVGIIQWSKLEFNSQQFQQMLMKFSLFLN